ncbi:MAG: hypothetical protein C0504_15345 [Candidatus Solibacter sp.]|nr:hypothetical protein [Candidatus Solibacter sp.]
MATHNETSPIRANKPRRVESEDAVDPTKKGTRGGGDGRRALGGRGRRPVEERMYEKVIKLIDAVCKNMVSNKEKVTLTDLVKLVQAAKEMRPQGCERMVVEWVDSMPEEG